MTTKAQDIENKHHPIKIHNLEKYFDFVLTLEWQVKRESKTIYSPFACS